MLMPTIDDLATVPAPRSVPRRPGHADRTSLRPWLALGLLLSLAALAACTPAAPAPPTPPPGSNPAAPSTITPAAPVATGATAAGAEPGAAGSACGTGAEPADPGLLRVVQQSLQSSMTTPFRDVRFGVLANDGTFARVLVCMQMRRSPADSWQEYTAEYALSNVAGGWRVDRNPIPFEIQTAAARVMQEASTAAATRIHAEVVRAEVREVPKYYAGAKEHFATIRWLTDDHARHVIQYALSFAVSGHNCLPGAAFVPQGTQPRDAEQRLYLAMPLGADGNGDLQAPTGQETVGPDPVEKTYIAGLMPARDEDLLCSAIDNPHDSGFASRPWTARRSVRFQEADLAVTRSSSITG